MFKIARIRPLADRLDPPAGPGPPLVPAGRRPGYTSAMINFGYLLADRLNRRIWTKSAVGTSGPPTSAISMRRVV